MSDELLGAQAILSGVRPEVAASLVDLGLDLRGHSGVAWARARAGAERRG